MTDAASQPAEGQTTGGGSTFLTAEGVGNPQGAAPTTEQTPSPAPTNARPEWAPEKFWRADKNELDVEGLSKSYGSLEKMLSYEKVPVPKSWEDKEAADRWFRAAGRPDDPKGYEFEKPEKLPDGFYDDTAEQAFRDWAHNNGLNKHQAKNLHSAYVKANLERHAAFQEQQRHAQEKVKADLIREHGKDYDGFAKAAKAAMQKYSDPDFYQYLEETGLGNDPRMIRAYGRIGKAMMGETQLRGAPPAPVNTVDIDKQISEFRDKYGKDANGKLGGPLYDRTHPDHAAKVAEFNQLYALRYPEPPK